MTRPYEHSTMQDGHPRSLTDLQAVISLGSNFKLIPKPTKRYLKKLELSYMHCPDCESREIIHYGTNSSGTKRYRCKSCEYQFVAQFDAYFPRSKRRFIFEDEFLANLQRQGLNEGCGKKMYWDGALQMTLNYIESHKMKVKINKMIKRMPILGELDYHLMMEFIVHEAYVIVMG